MSLTTASMDDGVLSRTNLPAAISIGIGTGLLGGIIAEFAIAYPNVPTPSAKVAPAALFGLILIAPWMLRGIFTAGVQRVAANVGFFGALFL